MPQEPAAALSSLLRAATIDDHDEILKAANAAIKANKSDLANHQTRIIALLKLDRYEDVLRAIDEGGIRLESLCGLEKAYALYKTGRLDEATSVLKAIGLSKRSLQHVAAQVAYRAERFDEAHNIYSRLLGSEPGEEENDMTINVRAALAQTEWQGFAPFNRPETSDADGFELCYNTACTLIAHGEFEEALKLLQRAVRLCDASEDLLEEDKQAELRPILAQQAFVYSKIGKVKEALDLYQSLDQSDEKDPDFKVIVKNNLLAMDNETANPFLLQRKFGSVTASAEKSKLFKYQSNIIHRNNFVVDLKSKKAQGIKDRTETILDDVQHPNIGSDVGTISVLDAAATAHGLTGQVALRKLIDLSKKRPNDVGIVLTIVQIQFKRRNTGAALAALESLFSRLESDSVGSADVRFSPGLVALAVSLMRAQGRQASAKAELVKAATHWQDRPATTATSLLKEAGIELLRSSNPQDLQLAGSSFKKLFDEQQGSHIATAGLVASLAPSDPSRIQQHLADLPPVESLIDGIDVNSLLNSGVATTTKVAQGKKRPATDDASEKATKKRRKPKLPKDYDPSKKPDPERWLPLRDRSSYRPKGKKGKKKAGESTQGGIVKEEETLELVGGGGVKVEKATPSNSANKKKKKGKK